MIQCAILGIPKGMKKCSSYFYCSLSWRFDQRWKYNFIGMQNKKPFEIILHVGRVTSLQSWVAKNHITVKPLKIKNVLILTILPTLKACNSPCMQYFKWLFVLHSLEVIFSFLIKKARLKAIEIEAAFFHLLGNPKGRTLDHFFYASHIRHNFPYKLIPISMSWLK